MFKKVALFFGLGSLGAIILIGVVLVIAYLTAPTRFNVLIIGTDQRAEEKSRSDVLMVFSIPKSPKEQITLLTIPRDTRVEIPGEGEDKITHAYAYGKRAKGEKLGNSKLSQGTVENFLDIKIDGVLEFNFKSYAEIVDLLGGVTVNGKKMKGEEALLQVRNRYRPGGDFARTEDQRDVFGEVMKLMKSRENFTKIYSFLNNSPDARLTYSKTPLVRFGLGYLLRRAWFIIDRSALFKIGDIKEEVIPGKGGMFYSKKFNQKLYFWIPDLGQTKALVERAMK